MQFLQLHGVYESSFYVYSFSSSYLCFHQQSIIVVRQGVQPCCLQINNLHSILLLICLVMTLPQTWPKQANLNIKNESTNLLGFLCDYFRQKALSCPLKISQIHLFWG